jgi:hypothetical protein
MYLQTKVSTVQIQSLEIHYRPTIVKLIPQIYLNHLGS